MRRVAVFGLPGTGKTTLAIRLAGILDAPHHDLDRTLFTTNGPLPLEEFRNQTAQLTSTDAWIVDGNYSKLRDVTWHRADTLVWLDYNLPLIMWRVTHRNLRRLTHREAAPSGFTWQRAFFSRRSVLSNAVRKWFTNRRKYARYAAEASASGVKVLRFRTPRQAEQWLTALEATPEEDSHGTPD